MSGLPAVCLVILDGWGLAPDGPGNAVSIAETPVFDGLWARYPHTTLTACGEAVGLPAGQMGNSEVGHLNLGAGAIVKQDLTLIDEAAEQPDFGANEVLLAAMRAAPRVHLIGLVSDGGVHSSIEHLRALIETAARVGVEDLVIHAITDGRDTLPTNGAGYLDSVEEWCAAISDPAGGRVARVASVIGRYFAMDRDSRWDRVQLAYDLFVHGLGAHAAPTASSAVRGAYERGETDEFVAPTVVGGEGSIRPGDSVIALNFRPDRMRELSCALAAAKCPGVERRGAQPVQRYTTLTKYGAPGVAASVAFVSQRPTVTLPSVIADTGGRQLHVAETEKYPHVTYFFGGGNELPEEREQRRLVPSPRDVPTYDFKPEMSAREATDAFVAAWAEQDFLFAVINFANPDMVGHTGIIPAAVTAIEIVDTCLARVVEAVQGTGGACIVTADHGNADHMLEPDGSPNTAHSLNPVPIVVTVEGASLDPAGGILADVAPTALELLGIAQPPEMTGRSLLLPRPVTVAGAALALFVGAALQSATGFGFALVSAPILFALLGPHEAVTAGFIVAILLNSLTLASERRRPRVLVRDAVALVAWSLPGIVAGVLVLRSVPEQPLSVVVAVAVLAGLALRVRSRRADAVPAPRAWHVPVAGVSAGALGTSTSLNGPPLVFCLLARRASPAQMRDTLAAIFLAEAVLGVPALLLSSTFTMPPAIGLLLLAGLAGQLLGRPAFGWLQGERYERAVLAALAATALVALATSVV